MAGLLLNCNGVRMKPAFTIENTAAETFRGLGLMVCGALLLPGMDTVAKYLGSVLQVPTGEVALGRFILQAVLTVPLLLLLEGPQSFRIEKPMMHLLRGALTGVASILFFTALKFMPLADAISIFFVEPFILTILSAVVLKETVGWHRRIAIVMGFVGALIVIRPSFAVFGVVALFPLGTATLFSIYLLFSRQLTGTASPLAMQLYAGVGGAISVFFAMIAGTMLDVQELRLGLPTEAHVWMFMLLLGAVGLIGHFLVTFAFQLAPASMLAPFQYLEIISATLLGFLVFGDYPDALKWLGVAIIVSSGLYLFWREQLAARQAAPVSDEPLQGR
ncbi:DMT family transporter [Consotaella aegiceratis]|uniref:DMT family transporter n=1 Tax=Consotaella aegiceratis TaxID=3097961 RepID=UPI002F40AB16